jgi:hypothetical protein
LSNPDNVSDRNIWYTVNLLSVSFPERSSGIIIAHEQGSFAEDDKMKGGKVKK